MLDFDPNSAPGEETGIFGLPHKEKDAALVLVPVPWEATTSYGGDQGRRRYSRPAARSTCSTARCTGRMNRVFS